jgi:hypothetical protein
MPCRAESRRRVERHARPQVRPGTLPAILQLEAASAGPAADGRVTREKHPRESNPTAP